MKWIWLLIGVTLLFSREAYSSDYMVELFEEHYKEKMIVGGGELKVYHVWQVKTEFGNKLLVIVGDDHNYRTWLRKFMKNHNLFIVKIPDAGDDAFKYDLAVNVNVQQIHAVWENRWSCDKCRHGFPPHESTKADQADIVLPGAPSIAVE